MRYTESGIPDDPDLPSVKVKARIPNLSEGKCLSIQKKGAIA